MNYFKFLFSFLLIYLTLISWSFNNWLTVWFVMEVNFLIFMGLLAINVSYSVVEVIVKYFIIQIFISLLLLTVMFYFVFNVSFSLSLFGLMILFMKLGLFPFHFWIIMILGKLDWLSFFMLMTIMKLIPILMVYYMSSTVNFSLILLISSVVGSIMGMNNPLLQKLMGYSSMIQLCWLLVSLEISLWVFILYFTFYFFLTMIMTSIFYNFNVFYLNQYKMLGGSLLVKMLIFLIVFSLMGFPPFLGFVLKWVVSSFMFWFNLKLLFFTMIMFSVFSSIFYLQLFYYFMLIYSLGSKWFTFNFVYSWFMFFTITIFLFYLITYCFI